MRLEQFGRLKARVTGGTDGVGGGDGPVVVLLHGFGAPGGDLVPLARELALPAETRFVFPEGPLELDVGLQDARAWWMIDMEKLQEALVGGRMRDLSREVPPGLGAANEALNGLLDAVQTQLRVPSERLVLGGFSQGAMLAMDVALRGDRPLAGLALLSGTLLAAEEWSPLMVARAGLRVFQSHGMSDPVLPFILAERLRDQLRAADLEVQWVPFPGGHDLPLVVLDALGEALWEMIG